MSYDVIRTYMGRIMKNMDKKKAMKIVAKIVKQIKATNLTCTSSLFFQEKIRKSMKIHLIGPVITFRSASIVGAGSCTALKIHIYLSCT